MKDDILHYADPSALSDLVASAADGGSGATPYILVDVRTPEEYAGGHIGTAINIPVSSIGLEPPTGAKDALIIVYCRSGGRSATAKQVLEGLGYSRVVNFGGVGRWTGPLVRGREPSAP